MSYECPKKIYKYLSVEGLVKTLKGRSLKFSRPSDFNDPFDLYIQDVLVFDDIEFLNGVKSSYFDFLTSSNEIIRSPVDIISVPMLQQFRDVIQRLSPGELKEFKEDFISTPIEGLFNLESIRKTKKEVSNFFSESFLNDGVFCSTTDNNNLLMWSHYAEQHRGAVIELTPDVSQDSMLLASKPVLYSKNRPLVYRNPEDMISHSFFLTAQESIEKVLSSLVYTKSTEWAYENEYRLYVPKLIPPGKPFEVLEFNSQELTNVFLGCRMDPEVKQSVVSLLKKINELAGVYQAKISKRRFSIDFEKII